MKRTERAASQTHSPKRASNERLTELAEILAVGVVRLRARKSSGMCPDIGESSLDCVAHQSGDQDPCSRESEG
jgi:hypothetical protein